MWLIGIFVDLYAAARFLVALGKLIRAEMINIVVRLPLNDYAAGGMWVASPRSSTINGLPTDISASSVKVDVMGLHQPILTALLRHLIPRQRVEDRPAADKERDAGICACKGRFIDDIGSARWAAERPTPSADHRWTSLTHR